MEYDWFDQSLSRRPEKTFSMASAENLGDFRYGVFVSSRSSIQTTAAASA